MESTWINPESSLLALYNLPHNKFGLTANFYKDELFISQQKIQDIARVVGPRAKKKDFYGAKLFIRAEYVDEKQSDKNWWLDAEGILKFYDGVQEFKDLDITKYVDEVVMLCKEYFAEFGRVHRIATLALPKGEGIIGIMQSSMLDRINPYLASSIEKIYFPINNPEWVQEYSQF